MPRTVPKIPAQASGATAKNTSKEQRQRRIARRADMWIPGSEKGIGCAAAGAGRLSWSEGPVANGLRGAGIPEEARAGCEEKHFPKRARTEWFHLLPARERIRKLQKKRKRERGQRSDRYRDSRTWSKAGERANGRPCRGRSPSSQVRNSRGDGGRRSDSGQRRSRSQS